MNGCVGTKNVPTPLGLNGFFDRLVRYLGGTNEIFGDR